MTTSRPGDNLDSLAPLLSHADGERGTTIEQSDSLRVLVRKKLATFDGELRRDLLLGPQHTVLLSHWMALPVLRETWIASFAHNCGHDVKRIGSDFCEMLIRLGMSWDGMNAAELRMLDAMNSDFERRIASVESRLMHHNPTHTRITSTLIAARTMQRTRQQRPSDRFTAVEEFMGHILNGSDGDRLTAFLEKMFSDKPDVFAPELPEKKAWRIYNELHALEDHHANSISGQMARIIIDFITNDSNLEHSSKILEKIEEFGREERKMRSDLETTNGKVRSNSASAVLEDKHSSLSKEHQRMVNKMAVLTKNIRHILELSHELEHVDKTISGYRTQLEDICESLPKYKKKFAKEIATALQQHFDITQRIHNLEKRREDLFKKIAAYKPQKATGQLS